MVEAVTGGVVVLEVGRRYLPSSPMTNTELYGTQVIPRVGALWSWSYRLASAGVRP
jgi:hypothetical protein